MRLRGSTLFSLGPIGPAKVVFSLLRNLRKFGRSSEKHMERYWLSEKPCMMINKNK
jgi:hypothetical protein